MVATINYLSISYYYFYLFFLGVVIHKSSEFSVGSTTSVSCRSDSQPLRIEWLNDDNEVVASVNDNSSRSLNLTFNPVNDTIHGKIYICKVEIRNETSMNNEQVSVNFTVEATGK